MWDMQPVPDFCHLYNDRDASFQFDLHPHPCKRDPGLELIPRASQAKAIFFLFSPGNQWSLVGGGGGRAEEEGWGGARTLRQTYTRRAGLQVEEGPRS